MSVRTTLLLLAAVSLVLMPSMAAYAYSTTVEPVSDTWIDEDDQDANYGTSYYLEVRTDSTSGDPDASALLKFNLPTLPGNARVDSARVLVNYCARSGWDSSDWVYIGLYAVEPNGSWPRNWQETQATWDNYDSTHVWDISGCDSIYYDREANYDDRVYFDYYTGFGYKTWVVTDRVKKWYAGQDVNRGWLMRTQSNNDPEDLVFYSREYSPSWRPKLVVDYTIIPEPSGVAAVSTGLLSLFALRRRRVR